jgi:tetratricopeptide (TPR) repeat protein
VDAGQAAAEECLHAARRRADLGLILSALNPMGLAMDRRGDLEQSLLWHRRALMLATLIGATPTRYLALSNVAMVRMQLGHPPAERLLRLSIVLNGRVGNKSSVAESRNALGVLYRKQGRFAEAIDQHRQALDAGQQLPEWRMRSLIRNHFGETLLAVGDKGGAADMFRQAGELAQAAEARYELACSLTGLASTLADDDPRAARRHLRRALVMFREMNVPDQFAVEKRLAELGGIEGTPGS